MKRMALTRPEAILCAVFPIVAFGLVNALYKEDLIARSPALYWLQDVLTFVVFPATGAMILARFGGLRPAGYGFQLRDPRWRGVDLFALTVLALVLAALSYGLGLKLGLSWWPAAEVTSRFETLLPSDFPSRLLLVTYLSVSAALVEEAVFRALPWAYVQLRVSPHRQVAVYAFGSALVFGVIHSEQGLHAVLATFLLGLAWALLYTRIATVWPLVFAHFTIDMWTLW